jgi:hypothetical protein
MKSLIQTAAVAVLLALPIASFAQSNEPATRAQVQAQLAQLPPTVSLAPLEQADGASQSGIGIHSLNNIGLKSIYIKH